MPSFNVLTDLKQEYIPELNIEFEKLREQKARLEKAEQDKKLLTADKNSEGSKTGIDETPAGGASQSSTSHLGIKVQINKVRSRPTSSS